MDDDRLEDAMRRGLQARADEVEQQREFAGAARERARGRRRMRVAAAGVAAAVVIVPVVVIASNEEDGGSPTDAVTQPMISGPATGTVPADWRAESYGGVQLYVPSDWGWGYSPLRDSIDDDTVLACGTGVGLMAGGSRPTEVEAQQSPYVGHPTHGSDMCTVGIPATTQPYVWFDSLVEPGTEDLPGGFTRVTVDVGDQRVSVASDNATERDAIIAAVEPVDVDDNGCRTDLQHVANIYPEYDAQGPIEGSDPTGDIGDVKRMAICAYANEDETEFVYSTALDGRAAQAVFDSIVAAKPPDEADASCNKTGELYTVLLQVTGTAGRSIIPAHLGGCEAGYVVDGSVREFSRTDVEQWAVNAVRIYVYYPGGRFTDLFAQPQG